MRSDRRTALLGAVFEVTKNVREMPRTASGSDLLAGIAIAEAKAQVRQFCGTAEARALIPAEAQAIVEDLAPPPLTSPVSSWAACLLSRSAAGALATV